METKTVFCKKICKQNVFCENLYIRKQKSFQKSKTSLRIQNKKIEENKKIVETKK